MTYTPNRVTTRDLETDEVVIQANLIQRNLDLISKETKNLQNQINFNLARGTETAKTLQTNDRFTQAFLFG